MMITIIELGRTVTITVLLSITDLVNRLVIITVIGVVKKVIR